MMKVGLNVSKFVFGTLAAAALTLGASKAQANYYSNYGTFQTYGSGTSDSGSTAWGWCTAYGYNSTNNDYELYQEACASGGTSGWSTTTAQNFEVESSGLIEVLSSTGTNLGCIDLKDNNAYDGAEIDIDDDPTYGCKTTNTAQLWEFYNGQIILGRDTSYCLQAPTSTGSTITLQTCNGSYAQMFTPINISVQLQSGESGGGSYYNLDVADDYDCTSGNYIDAYTQNGTPAQIFQFQPSNYQYWHATLTTQQNASGAAFGLPIELTGNVYDTPVWQEGGSTCGSMSSAFSSGLTTEFYAYAWNGNKLENAQPYDQNRYDIPSCLTWEGNGSDVGASECSVSPPSSQIWNMTILNFPN